MKPRPLSEWHEEMGDVLWWKFPITEPPYVGGPLDLPLRIALTFNDMVMADYEYSGWPGYHTHWTPLEIPETPNDKED